MLDTVKQGSKVINDSKSKSSTAGKDCSSTYIVAELRAA